MHEIDDELDELALDNPALGSDNLDRRLGTSFRRQPGTSDQEGSYCVQINATPNPSTRAIPEPRMSSSRYPKRRRISERDKEPAPSTAPSLPTKSQQEERHNRGDSSPDELAPSSAHANVRPSRTASRPKRGGRERKKSLPEIQKVTAAVTVAETEPNEVVLETVEPEASDDELNFTATAATRDEEEVKDARATPLIESEENHMDNRTASAPDLPTEDQLDENIPATPQVQDMGQNDAAVVSPMDEVPQRAYLPIAEPTQDHPSVQAITQPSIEEPSHLEVPPLRRRSTFKGSFKRLSPSPSSNRYISKSPPPYSTVSTPVATPRELPPAPPQYVPYKEKMVLKGHKRAIAAVKFSPNGRLIASCCMCTLPLNRFSSADSLKPLTQPSESGKPAQVSTFTHLKVILRASLP